MNIKKTTVNDCDIKDIIDINITPSSLKNNLKKNNKAMIVVDINIK